VRETVLWLTRPANSADFQAIVNLVSSVGGDLENLVTNEFVVAEDKVGRIIGCGRLKRYKNVMELASLAVADEHRGKEIGRAIVDQLLKRQKGFIYLVCELNRVMFFERCGFHLSWPPRELLPKCSEYLDRGFDVYVMKWPDGV
jgi:N-acetylglutamate synthase-like GNAT family acetyltransferase